MKLRDVLWPDALKIVKIMLHRYAKQTACDLDQSVGDPRELIGRHRSPDWDNLRLPVDNLSGTETSLGVLLK